MDEFEYSVEISDRDWQCFFTECEECNLFPPSLAGVDSSGMSDLDDTESMLAKRVQKVSLETHFSDDDHTLDGLPDCEGSPVEQFLSKHGVSAMENVLSGSEEDLHLQSVNIFFERLKDLTEADSPADPSKVRDGKNIGAVEEDQQCSDGQQASISTTLPKNTPKLNFLSARGETAVGKGLSSAVDTISNINTMKKVEPAFDISPEPAVSNSVPKTNKTASHLFILEEASTEARVNEVAQENKLCDSLVRPVCSSTKPPKTDKVIEVDTCAHGLSPQLTLENIQWKEDESINVPHSDTKSTNKSPSQESSPSASIKRKRRKKRRLSAEPVESGHGGSTQDSEEEQCTWRDEAALCLSKDVNLLYSHKPQKNLMSPLYSVKSSPTGRISTKDIKVIGLPNYVLPCDRPPESIARKGMCAATGSAEICAYNNSLSGTPQRQSDYGLINKQTVSGNAVTHLQPCIKVHVDEFPEVNKYSSLPPSFSASRTDKSDGAGGSIHSERKEAPAGNIQPSSNIGCENNPNLKCSTAEVKSILLSILPSANSNDPAVEVCQSDTLCAAKSVQAAVGGKSGWDNHTLCQGDTEHQQQLEIDIDRYLSAPGKTNFLLSATGMAGADCPNTKNQQFTTRACPSSDEMSSRVINAKITDNLSNSYPTKSSLIQTTSTLDMNDTIQQTEHPLEVQILSKPILSAKNMDQKAQSEPAKIMSVNSRSPSEFTLVSSCCTLDTDSVLSASVNNITDTSENGSSVSQNDLCGQGEKQTPILAKQAEGEAIFVPKLQNELNDSNESRSDVSSGAEEVIPASKQELKEALDSPHSVFSISSFWSEMEKLTINDILGLRMMGKDVPPSSLPPLWENEEKDMFAPTDSGFFTQLDEPRPEQTNKLTLIVPDSSQSSFASAIAHDLSSSSNVMWDSEPAPVSLGAVVYPKNIMATSVEDISQPIISGGPKCLRKISKNLSVHNLHALESESFRSSWKHQTLPTSDVQELEKDETFIDDHVPKEDKDTNSSLSSLKGSYTTSLMDIFHYLFGGKKSVVQSTSDDEGNFTTCGNSVPETYDHFFSEFDTESFFCPLISAGDQPKTELVPIFSCSRSANRNLQFPEAYEYFFASSSSDDSSVESDEEDNCGSVKVVTRLTRKPSASKMSVDVYENFFTDSDLRENFFWKETFSFRNIKFTGSTQPISNPLSLLPVRQSDKSFPRKVSSGNVLGNQDFLFPDPLLCHLEDRISRQLAQQAFINEDLHQAVSNPRLDASFLRLRQSDMCLVCIAFASWVLKTTNPQAGDAWKAVLLANVSALSAIRYLRKYVKMESAASEEKLHRDMISHS